MKLRELFIWLLLLVVASFGQQEEETLISGQVESGGFGGFMVQWTDINGQSAVLAGGRGGWIINHHIILGGGGYGLASDIKSGLQKDGKELYVVLGYGGVWLEYVARPQKLLHFSVHALVGGGNVDYSLNKMRERREDEETEHDSFWLVEPGVTVTCNVTRFFRFGVGASLRQVSGVNLAPLDSSDLSGTGVQLFFNFGKF